MLSHRKSFSLVYGIQRSVFLTLYIISAVSVLFLILYLVNEFFRPGLFALFLVIMGYLFISIFFGSFLHLLLYIPVNLSGAFDVIKNDIARGNIKDVQSFAERVNDFITGFFNFSFFDIEYCIIQFSGRVRAGDLDLNSIDPPVDPAEFGKRTQNNKRIMYFGKYSCAGKRYYLYLIPVWFGDEWLGYMGLFCKQRLLKIFRDVLVDFECNFIDDQLIHLVRKEI